MALIVLLTVTIAVAPYVISQMKTSETTDYPLQTEDPIDDLASSFRRVWREKDRTDNSEEGDDDEESTKGALEYVLKDILQSKGLQQAAQQFLIRILESPEFQAALKRLVQQLWGDLIQDPETVQQVIRLLQFAIQDPSIKKASQELVIEVVQDPEVKEALIQTIQRLGQEKPVLDATQTLLTESAHNALNDPEILDHSMEFATDVVGDDLVQRTAGEALRKSVGHAVKPATSLALTAAGVGFMLFGVAAVGYARSSDQEAVLLETAAKSMQNNVAFGLTRMITWPGRVIPKLGEKLYQALVVAPLGYLQQGAVGVSRTVAESLMNAAVHLLSLPGRGLHALWSGIMYIAQGTSQTFIRTARNASRGVLSKANSLQTAVVSAIVKFVQRTGAQMVRWAHHSVETGLHFASHSQHVVISTSSRALAAADRKVLRFYDRLFLAMDQFLESIWKFTPFQSK